MDSSLILKSKVSNKRAINLDIAVSTPIRGVPMAQLMPMTKPVTKTGFALRVLSQMESPKAPSFDVRAALLEGRK